MMIRIIPKHFTNAVGVMRCALKTCHTSPLLDQIRQNSRQQASLTPLLASFLEGKSLPVINTFRHDGSCVSADWVGIDQGNDWFPAWFKPLPEPVLTDS